MSEHATAPFDSERPPGTNPSPLGRPVDFNVRGLGRQLPRTEAPEGWIRKIERRREGKVWTGFSISGRPTRGVGTCGRSRTRRSDRLRYPNTRRNISWPNTSILPHIGLFLAAEKRHGAQERPEARELAPPLHSWHPYKFAEP